MRRVSIAVLVAVSSLSLASAQESSKAKSAHDEVTKKEILKLEHEKVRALETGGSFAADWFQLHYADDIDYPRADGTFFTKAQTVDEFRTGARKLHSVQHDDYRVQVYGDRTAVLSYRGNDIMERNGKVGNRELVRTTDVYFRQDDGIWRIVVHHVSPIRPQ